ncbi:MAG TPA: N-acetylneuraminate synthase family protein [Candidatus Baltobacteraceae bacterium]|jgi:N-acetylneuraminate synthase/N,N'-diacetyllegionaminate synthase|nr:N-acetylneuraminate synthase family protein [Candidatus Baltobacteraceae bacterium]
MASMKNVRIGELAVGAGRPAALVAEIGINHNGDMVLAKRMIEAAARAGATSVKFQNYRTTDFIADRTSTYRYVSNGSTIVESQYEMFKRCELAGDDLADLKRACDRAGVIFHSTPTNSDGVAELVKIGAQVMKNGSDYLTNLDLIASMGQTGLPTVLSTGMATVAEIDDAVRAFRTTGNDAVILLHCTSSYPAQARDLHLQKIGALAATFDCPVGFSDHSEGVTAAIAAVTLGACWIEKHFTIDRTLPGPDQHFSSDEAEFTALVRAVRFVETALIDAPVGATDREAASRAEFRLSCQSARPLPAGHLLAPGDVLFRRPGTGLPPKMATVLIGRRLVRDVPENHVLSWEDVSA